MEHYTIIDKRTELEVRLQNAVRASSAPIRFDWAQAFNQYREGKIGFLDIFRMWAAVISIDQ